jgi:CBS-domain-containing membrane protein
MLDHYTGGAMTSPYTALNLLTLPAHTQITRPDTPELVHLKDPAIDVMTDLSLTPAFTTTPNVVIDEALEKMIHCGVRLLLVVNPQGAVIGLITSHDIMGDKPINFTSQERIPRDKIRVGDIMVPQDEIQVLTMKDVKRANIGDIVLTLREAGRQHALVVEQLPDNQMMVRGIFSATRIGKKLGVVIEPTGVFQSFAELEKVLQER